MQKKFKVPPQRIIDIIIELINYLEALHKLGYIHNNIEPGNIMLDLPTAYSNKTRLVIIDYGAAKKYDEDKKKEEVYEFIGDATFASM